MWLQFMGSHNTTMSPRPPPVSEIIERLDKSWVATSVILLPLAAKQSSAKLAYFCMNHVNEALGVAIYSYLILPWCYIKWDFGPLLSKEKTHPSAHLFSHIGRECPNSTVTAPRAEGASPQTLWSLGQMDSDRYFRARIIELIGLNNVPFMDTRHVTPT